MGISKIFIFHNYCTKSAYKRYCNWKLLNSVIIRHDMFSTSPSILNSFPRQTTTSVQVTDVYSPIEHDRVYLIVYHPGVQLELFSKLQTKALGVACLNLNR